MDPDFLDWALADFSGYVAADELYDGPFCILSAVDNRRYKRILSPKSRVAVTRGNIGFSTQSSQKSRNRWGASSV
jgi:hypothetical protein